MNSMGRVYAKLPRHQQPILAASACWAGKSQPPPLLTNHDDHIETLLNVLQAALDEKCRRTDDVRRPEADGSIEIRERRVRDTPARGFAHCRVEVTQQLTADASAPQFISHSHAAQNQDLVLARQTNGSDNLRAGPRCEDVVGGLNRLRVSRSSQEGNGRVTVGADDWPLC
jgi:hypothetical protein